MGEQGSAIHYVCTHEEARILAFQQHRFWVSNCGCREGRGHCSRSRIDVCLMFRGDLQASGSGIKEIGLTDVLTLFDEVSEKHLVARPFRNETDKLVTDGICFCCDDCCGYFTNPEENKCDKGCLIERTEMDLCNFCGDCIEACYFKARKLVDGELLLDRGNCYGCGLCAEICPEKCISLTVR